MSKARNLSNTIRVDDAVTLPSGDTASRPAGAVAGSQRFNTDTGSIEFYDGTTWISTNLIPTVDSVTGTIYAGAASTLTIGVSNATNTITVRFSEGGSTIADVADVAVSAGSASVAVPSAVYGQTAGDTIAVSVLNQDGTPSSNAITKTVVGLPTGGTITTSGGYRIHTFTSSSSLVVPSGLTLTNVEYVVVAGGGGGASNSAGGGGAGGYRSSVSGESSGGGASAEASLSLSPNTTYTVTIGAGGAGGSASPSNGADGSNGSNSVFGTITSIGGGRGLTGVGISSDVSSGGSSGGNQSGNTGVLTRTTGQGYIGGLGSANNGGGDGGNGVSSSITGTAVTRAGGGGGSGDSRGSSGGFGGGGGGASAVGGNAGLKGSGAGGNGGSGGGAPGNNVGGSTAASGTANTGGGGGGGAFQSGNSSNGGAGGSGIVIVRYQL